ncbi:SpvB/TcaC N-terminal domain-containing protein [Actinoplanes sp. NPDC051346]|uniref:SpvB/TcaC N-terminal domain-containing protein n=1 Tax=Actinoplanes sp. NPDC051346 TaxID=3155048 RepID=UPI00342E5BBD
MDPSAGEQRALFTPPAVTLPTGGGAVRGIGEKFSANAATGTGSFSVPLALSPGRSAFQPELSLSYDSGTGNGPFGLGWSLDCPSISRKTDKGLPRYDDAGESDVFLLSGSEDLVPAYKRDSAGELLRDDQRRPVLDESPRDGYLVRRYRPRTEGQFARVERWTKLDDHTEVFWRTITATNVTTIFGKDDSARVDSGPAEGSRIFTWLISESYDDLGNAVQYEYKQEDLRVEARRSVPCTTQRYLKYVRYGNQVSRLDPARPDDWREHWLFEVVFDYGEGHWVDVPPDDELPANEQHHLVRATSRAGGVWAMRPDPHSTFRPGFEVRTHRRCHRVLVFHRLPELGPEPCLVHATEFDYRDLAPEGVTVEQELHHEGSTRFASFLMSVTQHGLERTGDVVTVEAGARYLTYVDAYRPSLTFRYSKPTIDPAIRTIAADDAQNLPSGIGGGYRWTDLDGDGISGLLSETGGAWWYKRNVGGGEFAALELVGRRPAAALADGARLLDLAGDGLLDLVDLAGPAPGFYERTDDAGWAPHRRFRELPNVSWTDRNLHFTDVDGDGRADLLITRPDAFVWHPSLGKDGFGAARRTLPPRDLGSQELPLVGDNADLVTLADMSGDGQADLVQIANGEVCYWPHLGYGRFGGKVVMEHPPLFDVAGQFDSQRVLLADLDGTGLSDIIYLAADGVRVYFNQAGNRWSDPLPISRFPLTDNLTFVSVLDLLGTGTACLVWSSGLPGDARAPLRFIDVMSGAKPHLLVEVHNNLGAETRIRYAPSTRFFLADRARGDPWVTRLPFPVHVVERIETVDRISRNRFVTSYSYHHGYFDGEEREFRGFGRVDQRDTEEYGLVGEPSATNLHEASYVPPVLTRTWFHTGAYLGREKVSMYFAGPPDGTAPGEYYREPGWSPADAAAHLLDDTTLPGGLSHEEEREACRALRGSMLRQEIYALDGSGDDRYPYGHPYLITEQNFTVRGEQPRQTNRHGVFLAHPREAITSHYERDSDDPRIAHSLTLAVNDHGQVTRSASIVYPRRKADPELSDELRGEQRTLRMTCTEHEVTNAIDDPVKHLDDHRAPAPFQTRTYEVTGLTVPAGQVRLTIGQVRLATEAATLDYHETPTAGLVQRRLLSQERTLYRKNDLSAACGPGVQETQALPFEGYRRALTSGLLARVFRRPTATGVRSLLPDPASVLAVGAASSSAKDLGGYVDLDGDGAWWVPSGRLSYAPASAATPALERNYARRHFFLPRRYRTAFHTAAAPVETQVAYDEHDLRPVEMVDAAGNRVRGDLDYRVLSPMRLTDPNDNVTAVAFDALGLVVATALMGKQDPRHVEGDKLNGFSATLTSSQIRDHFHDPRATPRALIGQATTRLIYDLFAYERTKGSAQPSPAGVCTIARETHRADLADGQVSRLRQTFTYSDGFGRVIQRKVEAEPGRRPLRDEAGVLVVEGGRPKVTPDVGPRWVGSGWTEFNNKGSAVRHYEPFFSDTHRPDFDARIGVTDVVFYDPLQRAVAVLHPDHTYEKTVLHPWWQRDYDVNDTVAAHGDQTGDPRTDPHIGPLVKAYFDDQGPGWLPWREQRRGGALGADEEAAAVRAAAHADTPTTTYLDALGRVFLTRAHNGFTPAEAPVHLDTRALHDIQGNKVRVVDALGRITRTAEYDMLGNPIQVTSMEAGRRWILNDCAGNVLRSWDSRGHDFGTEFDALRRPERFFVRGTDPAASDPDTLAGPVLYQRLEYGEHEPNAAAGNLRGRLVRQFDGSGWVASGYDFKGNVTRQTREVAAGYHSLVDWQEPQPAGERFLTSTTYDALNRPCQLVEPHGPGEGAARTVVQPVYSEAGLLKRLDAWTGQVADPPGPLDPAIVPPSPAGVVDISYDAHGRRTRIAYRNGAVTRYRYDPDTFRLVALYTTRGPGFTEDCGGDPPPPRTAAPEEPPVGLSCGVQNLHYTYDPAGNLTRVRDAAQQRTFFRNQLVDASCDYTVDPLYRLIQATGREHLGQAGQAIPHSHDDGRRIGLPQPGEGDAVGRYCETYAYDPAGNLAAMTHRATCPGAVSWSRTFEYAEASQIEDGDGHAVRPSNRLTSSAVAGATEVFSSQGDGYDAHGNPRRMPQLQAMAWDFRDRLRTTQRQAVNPDDAEGVARQGERTYYVYDSAGERVRKVTETAAGRLKEERIYLGGFELYRKHSGQHAGLERETFHLVTGAGRVALVETRNDVDDGTPVSLVRYQLGNHLGSSSLELDEQAKIISYEEYTPYGSTSYQAVRRDVQVSLKRYRHTAKERDEESGLSYHGARYYAPWLARWVNCDPSGPADGPNLYLYVSGRPLMFHDPTGREEEQLWLIDQKQFTIAPVARAGNRGITPLQNKALRGLDYAFGRGQGGLHWLHPDDMPFVIQPAGTRVRLTPGPGKQNMDESFKAGEVRSEAVKRGEFARVRIDGQSRDLTVAPGTSFKAPPPEAFEADMAAYAKQFEARAAGQAAPAGELEGPPAPAAAPSGGTSAEQLKLPFDEHPPAAAAPKPAPAPAKPAPAPAAAPAAPAKPAAGIGTQAKNVALSGAEKALFVVAVGSEGKDHESTATAVLTTVIAGKVIRALPPQVKAAVITVGVVAAYGMVRQKIITGTDRALNAGAAAADPQLDRTGTPYTPPRVRTLGQFLGF